MINDKSDDFIGIIVQPTSNNRVTFVAENKCKLGYGELVGFKINAEEAIVAVTREIKANYYLEEPDLYFLSKASKNSLDSISAEGPLFALEVTCEILGHYTMSVNGDYILKDNSTNLYTPKPLEKVYRFNSLKFQAVFGFNNDGFKVGTMCYPYNFEAKVKYETFKKHTFVSGVTGSGKSRFIAHLAQKLLFAGAHLTIIDPHDEYTELLASDSTNYQINRISINDTETPGESVLSPTITKEKLFFSEQLLNAPTISQLLPNLSSQQEEQVHNVFNKTYKDVNSRNLDSLINAFQKKVNEDGKKTSSLRATLYDVYWSLYVRLSEIKNKGLIRAEIPSWLSKKTFCADIIFGDHNNNEFGKRFITALFHQFLRIKSQDKIRVIIIEEAHQLLMMKDKNTINAIEQLLRESRKFNTSIILSTQNNYDVPESIKSQFQNIVTFRESHNTVTNYYPNKMCNVFLYGAKSNFIMEAPNFMSKKESSSDQK